MADLGEYSRLKTTDEIIVDGKETLGAWDRPSFLVEKPSDEFIATFTVSSALEGRPDLISNQVYGTPLLDWVIISFNAVYNDNGARDVLNWPKSGDIITYPVDSVVFPEVVR